MMEYEAPTYRGGTVDPAELEYVTAAPDAGMAAASAGHSGVVNETAQQRARLWFFEPLRRMGEDDGYIIVMVLFALYERRYRVARNPGDEGRHRVARNPRDERFGDGHPFFRELAADIGTTEVIATRLWRALRNGLAHRALPRAGGNCVVELTSRDCGAGGAFSEGGERPIIRVNPRQLRDRLLAILEPDERMWDDEGYPLPVRYCGGG